MPLICSSHIFFLRPLSLFNNSVVWIGALHWMRSVKSFKINQTRHTHTWKKRGKSKQAIQTITWTPCHLFIFPIFLKWHLLSRHVNEDRFFLFCMQLPYASSVCSIRLLKLNINLVLCSSVCFGILRRVYGIMVLRRGTWYYRFKSQFEKDLLFICSLSVYITFDKKA